MAGQNISAFRQQVASQGKTTKQHILKDTKKVLLNSPAALLMNTSRQLKGLCQQEAQRNKEQSMVRRRVFVYIGGWLISSTINFQNH